MTVPNPFQRQFRTIAHLAGASDDMAIAAEATVTAAPASAFSGWIASGKDSVAAAVNDQLIADGLLDADKVIHLSMAAALKDEGNVMLDIMRASASQTAAVTEIAGELSIELAHAVVLVDALAEFCGPDADWDTVVATTLTGRHSRMRTDGLRRALQYHGTEVRRAQDENYWVKRGQYAALVALANGHVPHFTDCRFPNEVYGCQAIGLPVFRLEISREEQARRLALRDGLTVTDDVLYHESETALDTFADFDHRIDNMRPFDIVVPEICDLLYPTRAFRTGAA